MLSKRMIDINLKTGNADIEIYNQRPLRKAILHTTAKCYKSGKVVNSVLLTLILALLKFLVID